MASIVGCPNCASNLELPAEVDIGSRAACPVCQAEFPVCQAPLQALPKAVVLSDREEFPTNEPPPPDAPAAKLPSAESLPVEPATPELPTAKLPKADAPADELPAAEPSASESSTSEPAPTDARPTDARPSANESSSAEPPASDRTEDTDRLGDLLSSYLNAASEEAPSEEGPSELAPSELAPSELAPSELAPSEVAASETAPTDTPLPEFPVESDESTKSRVNLLPSIARGSSLLSELDDTLDDTLGDTLERPLNVTPADAPDAGVVETATNVSANVVSLNHQFGALDLSAPNGDVRRSRRPLAIRIAASLLAVVVGAYGAIWIGGPSADIFHLAAGPRFLLPPSMWENAESPPAPSDPGAIEPASAESAQPTPSDDAAAAQLAASDGSSSPAAVEIADERTVAALFADPNVRAAHNEARGGVKPALSWPVSALRDPQFSSIEALQSVRESAEPASVEFLQGDLLDRDAVGRKGRAYMTLAELAERLTLADPADNRSIATTQRLVAKEVLLPAVSEQSNRESLAQIASRWLQYSGRPNQGILFVGRVADMNAVGKDVQYVIELQYQGGNALANVLQEDLSFRTGETVGVIGIILDDPGQQLLNYQGESSQLVLPAYIFDPDAVAEKAASMKTLALPLLIPSP